MAVALHYHVLMQTFPILYSFRRCPYAMRARLAIAVSGVACELREVVLRNKPQALLDASPKGTVPVLVGVDGAILHESLDIMLWALQQNDPDGWLAPEEHDLTAMLALIAECDGAFKFHLDRYKYPQRHARANGADPRNISSSNADGDASNSASNNSDGVEDGSVNNDSDNVGVNTNADRDQGALWLSGLNSTLEHDRFLFGQRVSLADMAIVPFVRQFAHTDLVWFQAMPWPQLQLWLQRLLALDLFGGVMEKYAPWEPGAAGPRFPVSG